MGQWLIPVLNPWGVRRNFDAVPKCWWLCRSIFLPTNTGWWLGHPSEKYERQLGWLATQYMGKITNVPNHQPEYNIILRWWSPSNGHLTWLQKAVWTIHKITLTDSHLWIMAIPSTGKATMIPQLVINQISCITYLLYALNYKTHGWIQFKWK